MYECVCGFPWRITNGLIVTCAQIAIVIFFLLRILRLSAQSKTYISIVQKRRSAFTDAYARNAQNCTWQNCVRKCQKFFPRNKSVFTWENVIPTILRLFTLYKCNPILVKLPRTNTIGMFILKETQKSITKN